MTVDEAYRDDGPIAAWILNKATRPRRAGDRRLGWIVPPLLRLFEYGFVIALTALAQPEALPFAFTFLLVLSFHHYDTVYRLRHQRLAPPGWVRAVGGGWEGRVVVSCILALAGALDVGLLAWAVGLAIVYAAESSASWVRFGRADRPAAYPGEDEDDVAE